MAKWVWACELEASELVLVEEEGEMVDGELHGALGALWGKGAPNGELVGGAWQSLEEEAVP